VCTSCNISVFLIRTFRRNRHFFLFIYTRIHVTFSSFAKVQSCFFLLVSVKALKRNLNPSCLMFDVLPFYSYKLASFEPCFGFATVICIKVETGEIQILWWGRYTYSYVYIIPIPIYPHLHIPLISSHHSWCPMILFSFFLFKPYKERKVIYFFPSMILVKKHFSLFFLLSNFTLP
jgi:hypothetical protein